MRTTIYWKPANKPPADDDLILVWCGSWVFKTIGRFDLNAKLYRDLERKLLDPQPTVWARLPEFRTK